MGQLLRFRQIRLTSPQSFLCQPAFNCNSSQMSDLFDDLLIARAWAARLAIIHRECRDYFGLRRDDRRRPTCAQRMGQSRLPIVSPQGINRDVLHDYLFAAVRGCPTGTYSRPDHDSIDTIRVGFWKAGCSTMPQAITVNQ